jgi:hypothetical protein
MDVDQSRIKLRETEQVIRDLETTGILPPLAQTVEEERSPR